MNYLAHAYLSFGEPEILVGNLISDFVKGKKKFEFPGRVQLGITLHRKIDDFTDKHRSTADAKQFFKPFYGLYAGAFVDIVYDHFLACDRMKFPGDELMSFAQLTYTRLNPFKADFPAPFRQLFRFMELQNWLYNYQFRELIYNSFIGLVKRAKYMDDHRPAFAAFENNYDALKTCYESFFPELYEHAFIIFHQMITPE